MQIINQLGLMLRANVLNQLSAKVKLASRHHSPARFTAALTGIDNRERDLANRFRTGRLSVEQLQRQATRLALQDVTLYSVRPANGGAPKPARLQPVENARAFHAVLRRAYREADPSQKRALYPLVTRDSLRDQARRMLADAFWQGHLSAPEDLKVQLRTLARMEAAEQDTLQVRLPALQRQGVKEIVDFIAARQPEGPDEASAPLRRRLQQAAAELGLAIEPALGSHARATTPDAAVPQWAGPLPSLVTLADAFWRGDSRLHDYGTLSNTVNGIVSQWLEGEPSDHTLPEKRCRRTFEVLEYIRQHAPRATLPGATAVSALLERHAGRIEQQAVDQLIAAGGTLPPPPNDTGSGGSSEA